MLQFFPRNKHLKITMYANSLLGVWPFIFEHHPRLRKLYKFYSNLTFKYYFLFIITAYVKFFQIITASKINFLDIFSNLAITLLYTVTIMRVYSLKTDRLKKIIKKIIQTENRIFASGDISIIKIYEFYAWQSQFTNKLFLIIIFLGKLRHLYIRQF